MDIWWQLQDGPQSWFAIMGALAIGHALADYSWQTDFMARAKNRHLAAPQEDASTPFLWIYVLSAHAAIHAGLVWIITGCGWLGLAEFVLHWLIDALRIEKKISFQTDQLCHLLTKVIYVVGLACC